LIWKLLSVNYYTQGTQTMSSVHIRLLIFFITDIIFCFWWIHDDLFCMELWVLNLNCTCLYVCPLPIVLCYFQRSIDPPWRELLSWNNIFLGVSAFSEFSFFMEGKLGPTYLYPMYIISDKKILTLFHFNTLAFMSICVLFCTFRLIMFWSIHYKKCWCECDLECLRMLLVYVHTTLCYLNLGTVLLDFYGSGRGKERKLGCKKISRLFSKWHVMISPLEFAQLISIIFSRCCVLTRSSCFSFSRCLTFCALFFHFI